jgi:uncharacterized repeat protein (TIGR02543 family)
MSGKLQLRALLTVCLLALGITFLASGRPAAADTDASLTLLVDPAGKGTATANPGPPYSNGQTVTLTATPIEGWVFDKWIVASDGEWWDDGWDYRVEVSAAAAGIARRDKPAEFALNFTQIWSGLGVTGTLDPNSIRVVEVDGSDNVVDEDVPFQFDKATDYNATNKAAGTLVLIMKGNTAAGATRRYHVYFDVAGKGFAPPSVTPWLTMNPNIIDADQASVKVESAAGTLFFHKKGGGFSSYNDANGNDWINYNLNTGTAGKFRGIPNAVHPSNGGHFHPGGNSMTTTIRNEGPIKVTLHVIETKNTAGRQKWQGLVEFYPDYTVFTMLVAPYDYYFLYEGTPGGSLNLATDTIVRSDGTATPASQAWSADLPTEEWVYAADPTVGRSLYMTNELDDAKLDIYTPSGGVMTILGFGREGTNKLLDMNLVPRKFTFGLMDETNYDAAKPIIYNAYRDLNTAVGDAEARAGASLGSTNPVPFTITGDHTITAQFKPAQFTLTVNINPGGVGVVTKDPDQATYSFGQTVQLAAAPTASGYHFAGWSGDASGTNPITQVTITQNTVVTANFAQAFTVTTNAVPPEGGTVTVEPSKATYQPGETITVTATANSGYSFTSWEGDLSGTNPFETVTVNGNLNITANFGQAQYTFNATSAGNGTVDWAPKKDFYAPGETITVTPTPAANYAFSNWTGDISSNTNPLVFQISGNTSVTANFVPLQFYTLTVTPSGGGAVTKDPDLTSYPTGTVVTLTAMPEAGKRFVGWGGDASGTELTTTVTMTADRVVTATFEDDTHPLNVTILPAGGGVVTLSPAGGAYPVGTEVTMTAVANSGFTFSGWGGAATGTNPTTSVIVVEGGVDVTANFTSLGPVTLTVNKAGDGTGEVQKNPDKTEYVWGEMVTLTAVPSGGSVFAGWSGDVTSNSNPLKLTMDGSKTVVATFIEPTGPFSDNFNACSLAAQWEMSNPSGLGTFEATGTTVRISVPEGTEHNLWKDLNNVPRIMQPADNSDFEFVVKFDSTMNQGSQIQGVIVEQDAQNYLRFDFDYSVDEQGVGTTLAFAGSSKAGKSTIRISTPITPADTRFLRVTRAGEEWTMAYSGDGMNWTDAGSFKFALQVKSAGIFAGNPDPKGLAVAPAFTAEADFFWNTAEVPLPEDTPLLVVNTVGGGTVEANPPLDLATCGQTVTLTAEPGLGWTFDSWSGDANGTSPTTTVLLDGPRVVTATFTGANTRFLLLPVIIR